MHHELDEEVLLVPSIITKIFRSAKIIDQDSEIVNFESKTIGIMHGFTGSAHRLTNIQVKKAGDSLYQIHAPDNSFVIKLGKILYHTIVQEGEGLFLDIIGS